MALTKVTSGLISADASSVDLNIDAGTLYIDSTNNRVGIGSTSPDRQLEIYGTNDGYMKFDGGRVGNHGYTVGTDDNGFIIYDDTLNTYRFTIDQDTGNAGIGISNPSGILHLYKASGTTDLRIQSNQYSANYGFVGGALGTNALGIYDYGASAYRFVIDGSGHKIFGKTTNSFSTVGTTVYGDATYNGLTEIIVNGHTALNINRLTSDGDLIGFYQAGSAEGSISVSGTTVSYNGGHLARWSQLADNTKDETIVKGTVMTNLNQMAEWTTDGVTEANEQLNCMAVSSVEGDVNVAGVFVNWDEDDEVYTADMNVAMTGDMVIRIAQGVTVAQGDLLMSAGDGTAKPQDDDIIRAKTIAKVTSTHVSHTYDDGSYLVPCVLMAC